MTHRTLPAPKVLYRHDAHVGEGPVWDPRVGKLLWVDIPNDTVFTTDPASGETTARDVGRAVGVVVPRASGGYVAAMQDGFYALEDEGPPELIAPVAGQDPSTRLNDGETDPQGRFWAGSMGWSAEPEAGALYRLDADGTVKRMLDRVTISNGLGWSPDGTIMYYVDTPTMRVDMFDFDPVSGDIANRREFVTIRHGGGRPDGLTVDSEGAVWVATWPGYGVHRYLPDGSLDAVIPLPVSNVSSIELGGPDLRDAFITTAWELLSDEEHAAQPLAGSLFHTRVDVPGQSRVAFAG
ncbi:MAG: SMP-30/gluconolactonase/LRE family protein [Candidatus Limnocylindrales bacterium]